MASRPISSKIKSRASPGNPKAEVQVYDSSNGSQYFRCSQSTEN